MTNELQDWIIARFIARADVVAIQAAGGTHIWSPLRADMSRTDSELLPWNRELLQGHLDKRLTLGHYMLNQDDNAKLFAFDIDWQEAGLLPTRYSEEGVPLDFQSANMREAWLDRANPHRSYMKTQMRELSHKLAALIWSELEIPTAVAYSGNKGMHVYGFTGEMPADEIRLAANMVIAAMNEAGCQFQLSRGEFEYTDVNPDPAWSYSNFTIEVFPKQNSINGGGFGNLMALPLGTNLKNPDDPKFFVDMRVPLNVLQPIDPLQALTATNPWADN